MRIYVETSDGKRVVFNSDRFGTVRDLKQQIGRAMHVPMGFARILYNGVQLPDDGLIKSFGIKRLSTVELIWRPVVLTHKMLKEKEIELEAMEEENKTNEAECHSSNTSMQTIDTAIDKPNFPITLAINGRKIVLNDLPISDYDNESNDESSSNDLFRDDN